MQRESTERRIAQASLAEYKRSAAAAQSRGGSARSSLGIDVGNRLDSGGASPSFGLLTSPWAARKSNHLQSNDQSVAFDNAYKADMQESSTVDRTSAAALYNGETSNASLEAAELANFAFDNLDANDFNQGAPEGQDSSWNEFQSNSKDEARKKQGVPVSESKQQKGRSDDGGNPNTDDDYPAQQLSAVPPSSATLLAIDLLQDVSQLMTLSSEQTYEAESFLQQSIRHDWEKLQAVLREIIDSYTVTTDSTYRPSIRIDVLVHVVLEVIVYRNSYLSKEGVEAQLTRCNMSADENTSNETKNSSSKVSVNRNSKNSKRNEKSQGNGGQSRTNQQVLQQRIIAHHVINLLIFLERVLRSSSEARLLMREMLLQCDEQEREEPGSEVISGTKGTEQMTSSRKRRGVTLNQETHACQTVDIYHRKRRRIVSASHRLSKIGPCVQLDNITKPPWQRDWCTTTCSRFFGWMERIFFGNFGRRVFDGVELLFPATHDKTEFCPTNLHGLAHLRLLTFLRILSVLVWECNIRVDELPVTKALPKDTSAPLWNKLFERFLFRNQDVQSERHRVSDEASEEDESTASSHTQLQASHSSDLLSSVLHLLGTRIYRDAKRATVEPSRIMKNQITSLNFGDHAKFLSLRELQIKCTVVELYQKCFTSFSSIKFSQHVLAENSAQNIGQCMLAVLHELYFCIRFLKRSTLLPSKAFRDSRESDAARPRNKVEDAAIVDEWSSPITCTIKLVLNIVKLLIAYVQADPVNGVGLLSCKYDVQGESKLSWFVEASTHRNSRSRSSVNKRAKSGIGTLIEGLEYSVFSLFRDPGMDRAECLISSLENSHLLGMLVKYEMQLFVVLLSQIQNIDQSTQSIFGNHASTLLQMIGDAKDCFCSSCCLIAHYSKSCAFIDDPARCHAKQLLEEIDLDEEDEAALAK